MFVDELLSLFVRCKLPVEPKSVFFLSVVLTDGEPTPDKLTIDDVTLLLRND